MTRTGLVLVELNADRIGGHWPDRLVRLATAAARHRVPVAVVALMGVAPSTHRALADAGVMILETPAPGALVTRALLLFGKALGYGSDFARWVAPFRPWGWQFTLLSWCLIEAASLRAATHCQLPPGTTHVVLTASGALHGLVKRLARVPHVRVVHEHLAREGRFLRWIAKAGRDSEREVVVVCLTESVRREHAELFPRVPALVQRLALYDESDYLTEEERRAARAVHEIAEDELVIALVGGWWPYKDMATVIRAASLVQRRLRVIVAGTPVDHEILDSLSGKPKVQLTVLNREVERADHRRAYAAADLTIVARHPGVAKGSGLVTDAVRMGVPLVLSDHDPTLNSSLTGKDWVRLFRAGDWSELARIIEDLGDRPLRRPNRCQAAELNLMTSEEALLFLAAAGPPTCPTESMVAFTPGRLRRTGPPGGGKWTGR